MKTMARFLGGAQMLAVEQHCLMLLVILLAPSAAAKPQERGGCVKSGSLGT